MMAILILVVCGLLLRVFTSADLFLHQWDERYHALVARNMIGHPFKPTLYENPLLPYDFRNWSGNHIWIHKQPLPMWAMALSMRLFGVNEIAMRLPSILLSTLGIWLLYDIGRFFFNRKIAYLAALLFSINGLIIEVASGRVATEHIDTFFLFFIQLSVLFGIGYVQKKRTIFNVLAGLALGAAILTKWLTALIVLPVWFLIVIDSGQFRFRTVVLQGVILMASCAVIFMPWQIYIMQAFPREAAWEAAYNTKHIFEAVEEHAGQWSYFIHRIRVNYGEMIYLPLFWFAWITLKELLELGKKLLRQGSLRLTVSAQADPGPTALRMLALSIWFAIPFIFFSFVKTKMQGYMLITAPALFMMTSACYFRLQEFRKGRRLNWLYIIIMVLLIALPVRYSIERIKPFQQMDRNPEWRRDLVELGRDLEASGQVSDGQQQAAVSSQAAARLCFSITTTTSRPCSIPASPPMRPSLIKK